MKTAIVPVFLASLAMASDAHRTVSADSIPLRAAPSNGSKVLATLSKGDSVEVEYSIENTDGTWCAAGGERSGYVLCNYLGAEELRQQPAAEAALPQMISTPPPAPQSPAARPLRVVPSISALQQLALIDAAKKGDIVGIRHALENGALAGGRDKDGKTALLWAACQGQTAAALELLSAGADASAADDQGWTPLAAAVWARHADTAKLLLDHGTRVNPQDREGRTPLTHAARYGDLQTIRDLIEKGGDPNTSDPNGQTPLMLAVALKDPAAAEALIAAGADVSARDAAGRSVLIHAVLAGVDRLANVQLLIEHGAQINSRDSEGRTPYSWALKKGNQAAAQFLKKSGAVDW